MIRKQVEGGSVLELFTDPDWSGNRGTPKSVSACIVAWDGMVMHASSRTQLQKSTLQGLSWVFWGLM